MKHFIIFDLETDNVPHNTAYKFPPYVLEEWFVRAIQAAWQVYD